VYKSVKSRGTKDELIYVTKISTSFAEARQSHKAMQADDDEEASSPSSPTLSSESQSCLACADLIPRDLPRPTLPVRLACHRWSSEHVGQNEISLLTGGEQANNVRGDDLKVRLTECIPQ